MAKKTTKNKTTIAPGAAPAVDERLMPPPGGATVRMYRIGHGDCFLIAFAGDTPNRPAYVLIDCGYKPGSPGKINPPAGVTSAKEIAADIKKSTGGRIDVAVITHEHQDHVNGITDKHFDGIDIGEAWFAWTENPLDDLANDLRKKFKDKLLGLVAARNRLAAAAGENQRVQMIDELLAFELGGEDEQINLSAAMALFGAASGESMNKKSMKIFKDKAKDGVKFLVPHERIHRIPHAKQVRVFPLGPPRDAELLESLDPTGSEEFHLGASSAGSHFAAAACAVEANVRPESPFAQRYAVAWDRAFDVNDHSEHSEFFKGLYGQGAAGPDPWDSTEAVSNADWRRIDKDWLYAADQLALDMNDQTNNSSLVLAFELGKGGKVLLFAADAQRGNWISWGKKSFTDGDGAITARDLLSRTVLYKVGHHGSHNATINGLATDDYANIAWMALGDSSREFCAMITAVRKWAETQKGWDHPLKAIKDALLKKAGGRVFQTDTDFDQMKKSDGGSAVEWDSFTKRTTGSRLYFDYRINP
jgi:beta-lactamase superfamily II metal-dependent hydrolase